MKHEITVKLPGTVLETLNETADEKKLSVEYLAERIIAAWCVQQIILDIKPHYMENQKQEEKETEFADAEIEGGGCTWFYVCGECHGVIDSNDAFCSHCGRKLKWD